MRQAFADPRNAVLAGLCWLTLCCNHAAAAELRVPQDYATIQEAIDAADGPAGDVVLVNCGIYAESLLIVRGKAGIAVQSAHDDPDCVTIDARGVGRVIHTLSPVTITGLTLTGGQGDLFGGGLFLSEEAAGTAIVRCVIRDSEARSGGGLYSAGEVTLRDCLVVGNRAEAGAGLTGSTRMTIVGCTFASNVATDWGGAIYGGSTFDADVSASTFYGNRATGGSGFFLRSEAQVQAERILIAFGQGDAIRCHETTHIELTCSDIFGNEGGDWVDLGSTACLSDQLQTQGNVSADPKFCAAMPAEGPWDLQSDSPCAPLHSGCGTIGAWDVGCEPVTTKRTTWGRLKGQY